MARIKVEDLPRDMKVSREEMKKVFGGRDEYPPPTWETEHSYGGYYIPSNQSIPTDREELYFFTDAERKTW